MVAMAKREFWSLLIIDAVGGTFLVACAVAFIYLTVVRHDRITQRTDQLTQTIHNARIDLANLRLARDEQATVLTARRQELEETGRLPEESPTERYFQTLSTLAAGHELRVLRQHPLASKAYPGLLEKRFAYEVAGELPDIIRFLGAVESTDFWADVGYLRLSSKAAGGGAMGTQRLAGLTISMFSALPVEVEADDG